MEGILPMFDLSDPPDATVDVDKSDNVIIPLEFDSVEIIDDVNKLNNAGGSLALDHSCMVCITGEGFDIYEVTIASGDLKVVSLDNTSGDVLPVNVDVVNADNVLCVGSISMVADATVFV